MKTLGDLVRAIDWSAIEQGHAALSEANPKFKRHAEDGDFPFRYRAALLESALYGEKEHRHAALIQLAPVWDQAVAICKDWGIVENEQKTDAE